MRSLAFAVGAYLPIGTTLPIFVGGVVRWIVDRAAERAGSKEAGGDISSGSLFASGLIAAGGPARSIGGASQGGRGPLFGNPDPAHLSGGNPPEYTQVGGAG